MHPSEPDGEKETVQSSSSSSGGSSSGASSSGAGSGFSGSGSGDGSSSTGSSGAAGVSAAGVSAPGVSLGGGSSPMAHTSDLRTSTRDTGRIGLQRSEERRVGKSVELGGRGVS